MDYSFNKAYYFELIRFVQQQQQQQKVGEFSETFSVATSASFVLGIALFVLLLAHGNVIT